eukprot:TRINITY_DN1097_c0_g1_i4.p1 TRINITY_DN1097_c0_g1~~TRINITY_DN1097_c0_g1_i4.p1  ORF type:complete len:2087 (-),score=935.32 TRINITY_DN1097_c0_g1_i4:208-6468(-)
MKEGESATFDLVKIGDAAANADISLVNAAVGCSIVNDVNSIEFAAGVDNSKSVTVICEDDANFVEGSTMILNLTGSGVDTENNQIDIVYEDVDNCNPMTALVSTMNISGLTCATFTETQCCSDNASCMGLINPYAMLVGADTMAWAELVIDCCFNDSVSDKSSCVAKPVISIEDVTPLTLKEGASPMTVTLVKTGAATGTEKVNVAFDNAVASCTITPDEVSFAITEFSKDVSVECADNEYYTLGANMQLMISGNSVSEDASKISMTVSFTEDADTCDPLMSLAMGGKLSDISCETLTATDCCDSEITCNAIVSPYAALIGTELMTFADDVFKCCFDDLVTDKKTCVTAEDAVIGFTDISDGAITEGTTLDIVVARIGEGDNVMTGTISAIGVDSCTLDKTSLDFAADVDSIKLVLTCEDNTMIVEGGEIVLTITGNNASTQAFEKKIHFMDNDTCDALGTKAMTGAVGEMSCLDLSATNCCLTKDSCINLINEKKSDMADGVFEPLQSMINCCFDAESDKVLGCAASVVEPVIAFAAYDPDLTVAEGETAMIEVERTGNFNTEITAQVTVSGVTSCTVSPTDLSFAAGDDLKYLLIVSCADDDIFIDPETDPKVILTLIGDKVSADKNTATISYTENDTSLSACMAIQPKFADMASLKCGDFIDTGCCTTETACKTLISTLTMASMLDSAGASAATDMVECCFDSETQSDECAVVESGIAFQATLATSINEGETLDIVIERIGVVFTEALTADIRIDDNYVESCTLSASTVDFAADVAGDVTVTITCADDAIYYSPESKPVLVLMLSGQDASEDSSDTMLTITYVDDESDGSSTATEYDWVKVEGQCSPKEEADSNCGMGEKTHTHKCTKTMIEDGKVLSVEDVEDSECSASIPKPVDEVESCEFSVKCFTYEWSEGDWSDCSDDICDGKSTRSIKCLGVHFSENTEKNKIVSVSFCDSKNIPEHEKSCSSDCEIEYGWSTGDFGECMEVSCGAGVKHRTIKCEMTKKGDSASHPSVSVSSDFCTEAKPDETEDCSLECISYEWNIGRYSECDLSNGLTCGEGIKNRSVYCEKTIDGKTSQVDEEFCSIVPKPIDEQACTIVCEGETEYEYEWEVSDIWGPCSKTCRATTTDAHGIQKRSRKCYSYELDASKERQDSTKTLAESDMCLKNAVNDPIVERECFVSLCPDYEWILDGDWSECSAKCKGEGKPDPYQKKDIACINKNECDSAECAVNEMNCAGLTKPVWRQTCNTEACIIPVEWKTNTADVTCPTKQTDEVECGTGATEEIALTVECIISATGEVVADAKCASLDVERYKECTAFCNQDFRFEYSDWTACSSDSCDIGAQYRSKSCIKSVANRRLRFLAESRVDIDDCEDVGLLAEVTSKKCQGQTGDACKKYEWEYEWDNECSVTCGGGVIAPSSTKCMETIEGVEADDVAKCTATALTEKSCNNQKCPSFNWVTEEWGECDKPCGVATKTRKAKCVNDMNMKVSKKKCADQEVKLTETCTGATGETYNGEAFTSVCAAKTIYNWIAGSYGECLDDNDDEVSCGGGVSTRAVKCHKIVIDGSGSITEDIEALDDACVAGDKPSLTAVCNTRPCEETYRWFVTGKGECSLPCGGGSRALKNTCKNSKNQKVDDSKCDLLTKPETEESCNTNACNFCDDTDCNVAGDATHTCDRDTEKCVCNTDSWSGVYCQKDITCSGTALPDGTCCVGEANFDNECCDNASDIIVNGECCTGVDACGRCDNAGTSIAQLIPGTSTCCESGLISSGLVCCEVGSFVDECGVCGGLNDCLAKISTSEEKTILVDTCELFLAAMMDPETDTYKAEAIAAAAVFGVDLADIQFDSATCEAVAAAVGSRRLAETDLFNVGIETAVTPDGVSPSELAETIASNIATNAPSMESEVSVGGVCGDNLCHVDEVCVAGNEDNCCATDCPVVEECDAPEFTSSPCGGVTRGICESGICQCATGYVGDVCNGCAAGFVMDSSTYVCTKLAVGYAAVETCSDGIKNNGETAVDCGGANCPACVDLDTIDDESDDDDDDNSLILGIVGIIAFAAIAIVALITKKGNKNKFHIFDLSCLFI